MFLYTYRYKIHSSLRIIVSFQSNTVAVVDGRVNAENYIKYIGTSPYPESIFIDKHGYIKYVEGLISGDVGSASHFEKIIEELILQ